jgi:outer membrane biosynthesis protein TonB
MKAIGATPRRLGLRLSAVGIALLITAHRLPAPIQEVKESPTPAPTVSPTAKPKPKSKPKIEAKEPGISPARQQTTPKPSRFAGAWEGVMPTFPWGSIPQTITVDSAEKTMTRLRDWSSAQPGGTVNAVVKGNTLTADFGSGGVLSLTPQGDGSSAVVRLRAPFNNQSAVFRRMSP